MNGLFVISGNILVNLSQSLSSDVIKIGFVISIAFSFPLVIFPCRASLYSLLHGHGHLEANPFIPEGKFRALTATIVGCSLLAGLVVPSVELVIGLVGSTIGIAICIVFPACCFTKVSKKESTEMLLARFMIVCGLCLMVLGTYANLRAIDGTANAVQLVPENNLPEINVHDLPPVLKTDGDGVAPEMLEKLEYRASNQDSPVKKAIENAVREAVKEHDSKLEKDLSKVEEIKKEEEKNTADEKEKKEREQEEEALKKPLNNDAIKKEDDELKADKESKVVIQEELNAVVDEIKRQNEESQKKVLEKLEEIVERIEHKHEPAAAEPSDAVLVKKEPAIDQKVVEQVRDKFPDPIPLRAVNNNVIDTHNNRSGSDDRPEVAKTEEKKVIETANDINSNLIGAQETKSIAADLQKGVESQKEAKEQKNDSQAVQKESDTIEKTEEEKKSENEDVEAIRRDLLNVNDDNLARLKRSNQDCEKEI